MSTHAEVAESFTPKPHTRTHARTHAHTTPDRHQSCSVVLWIRPLESGLSLAAGRRDADCRLIFSAALSIRAAAGAPALGGCGGAGGGGLTWITAVSACLVAGSAQHVLQSQLLSLRFQRHGVVLSCFTLNIHLRLRRTETERPVPSNLSGTGENRGGREGWVMEQPPSLSLSDSSVVSETR